jgi:hypothetical protein
MNARQFFLRITRAAGALVGYGCLAAFLWLTGTQIYRWFRAGDWTHIGDTGRIATLMHWLDAPVDWLGVHKVLEIVPASLALFAASIVGNCIAIYCRDRLDELKRSK